MADSSKVRVVRCPKCDNLLPELVDYSVYQCGGCGAVLRAKDRTQKLNILPEKSDKEKVGEDLARSEKGTLSLSDAGDTDAKSNASSLKYDRMGSEYDDDSYAQRGSNEAKINAGKWVVENGFDMRMNRDGYDDPVRREHRESNSQSGYTRGSVTSEQMSDWRIDEVEEFRRNMRSDVEGARIWTSNYPDEGPSNYPSDSSYGFGEPLRNYNDPNEVNRVQYLEKERVELLRKLDEIKDQLSRSGDLVDKPKEKVPLDRRMVPPNPYVGSGSNRESMQFHEPGKHVKGPPYFNPHPEPFPYTNRYGVGMHGFHPPMHNSNHIPAYGDPYLPQRLRGAPQYLPGHFQQPSSHPHFPGQHIDTNPDPFEPYLHETVLHHPSCSCSYCYEKHQRDSNNSIMYHHKTSGGFGPRVHNSRSAIPLNSQDPLPRMRWPGSLNSEKDDFIRSCPQRVVLASGGRRCRPIAGGAPFLTCDNCFELLQLPKKILLMGKNQKEMRCGACSYIFNFSVVNRKLMLSVQTETVQIPAEVNDNSIGLLKESTPYSPSHVKRTGANFSSDDYDNSGYDFQSMDREPVASLTYQDLNSSKSKEMQSIHSSSPSISEDENSIDNVVGAKEVTDTVLQPSKATLSPPPPGSRLQEHFDYSSNNHAANRFTKGNQSSRSDHDKVIANKITTRQNSVTEMSQATEIEVSFNEYSNSGISQDSGDVSQDDYRPRNSKGGKSFFANIIKKSFKEFSESNQTVEHGINNVFVNGHLIADYLVRKAEKLAGPVRPGTYWYDSRAGFWGVMGSPCLGIIPPFIEEFNYPMPDNCAGGNTGVFVNGRELHQRDLDLLCSRGLPTAGHKSYSVDISGRVRDEDSGEELDSLGKLAPTVIKAKHGFGMKTPSVAV